MPPVALIGIGDSPSLKNSLPNNATNGTTRYVPEPSPIPHQDPKTTPRSGCRVSQCAATIFRRRGTSRTLSDRAPPGSSLQSIRPGSEGGRRRASSVVTHPPASSYDHAARATLERRRRTRRPELRDQSSSGAVSSLPPIIRGVTARGSGAVSSRLDCSVTLRSTSFCPMGRKRRSKDPTATL